jgi:hypothetical protein
MSKVNVLLIAGQSNALGISHFAELPEEYRRSYDVDIYFNTNTENPNNGKWQRVRPGLGHREDRFGLELPAAHLLAARGEEWVIIKYASDGTALYDRWNKARSAEDYNALMDTLHTAVRDLQKWNRYSGPAVRYIPAGGSSRQYPERRVLHRSVLSDLPEERCL